MYSKNVSITCPGEIYDKIEKTRGDIPRSKYILRLLEGALSKEERVK
jgi:hypothetical protein